MNTLTITEREAISITSCDYEDGNLSMITSHGKFSLDAPKESILRFFNSRGIFFKNNEEHIRVYIDGIPDIDKDNSHEEVITFEKFVRDTEPSDFDIKHYALKFMELWKRI